MKKIFAVTAGLVLAFSLTGCVASDQEVQSGEVEHGLVMVNVADVDGGAPAKCVLSKYTSRGGIFCFEGDK